MSAPVILRVGSVFRAEGVGDDNLFVVTYISDLRGDAGHLVGGGHEDRELAITAVSVSSLEHQLDRLQAQYDAVRAEVLRQVEGPWEEP